MKNVIIFLICISHSLHISSQIYTEKYINDANKIALDWLSKINHNNYESGYNLLSNETKNKFDKETWIKLISELMVEFGDLNSRIVTSKEFQSEIEGLEDGFYVFISYKSDYENTDKHQEFIILKQNDKAQWKILDYNYEFYSKQDNKTNSQLSN